MSSAAARQSHPSARFSIHGSGAERQVRKFKESNGDLNAVVDYMAEETCAGLF